MAYRAITTTPQQPTQTAQPRPPRQRINQITFVNLSHECDRLNAVVGNFEQHTKDLNRGIPLPPSNQQIRTKQASLKLATEIKTFLNDAHALINITRQHPALHELAQGLEKKVTNLSDQARLLITKHPEFSQLLRARSNEQ